MKLKKRRASQVWAVTTMLILLTFFAGACAGVDKAPIQQTIGKAEASINEAQSSQAVNYAPLELRMAEDKLTKAKTAFENEEYQRAEWLAEEALADANLAEAKSQSARTSSTVQQLQETIQTLQSELQRQQTQ